MSLRILFADDSVTAQNMGRKILTDAGYEVVAVSNGAAAVKKIAEQKPDIIILDLYMPGYSGLEVCEKVRGSVATLKTPVLLTVGKMEPYKPEEASRVRADGVIVKPFEASDLLAIIKKFEERIGQQPLVPEPVTVERSYENENVPEELPVEHPEPAYGSTPQATVDVPDHMATSSAFSDLLGADSAHSMNNFSAPPAPVVRETPPPPPANRAPIPEYGVPVSWREQIEDHAEPFSAAVPEIAEPFSAAVPEVNKVTSDAPPEAPARPQLQIPVYQEAKETPAPSEVVPTAMPATGEIEVAREPELQETAAEETRSTVADVREPDLMPTLHQESEPPAATESAASIEDVAFTETPALPQPTEAPTPSFAEAMESVPVAEPVAQEPVAAPVTASPEESAPVITETAKTEVKEVEAEQNVKAESDFEARVAAAMAAYSAATESGPNVEPAAATMEVAPEPPEVAKIEAPPAAMEAAPMEIPGAAPVQISEAHEAPARPYDYYPPAAYTAPTSVADPAPVTAADSLPVAHEPAAPPPAPAAAEPELNAAAQQAVAASVEAAVPLVAAAAAGAGAEADHHTIAQAVHRVMERLKPELVEEIMKELKPKQ